LAGYHRVVNSMARGPGESGDLKYDDGLIACRADVFVIRRYGLLLGPKTIPYTEIRKIQEFKLNALRRWRLWGTGDPRRWWNLDWGRRHKQIAFLIDLGKRVTPVITPDDPEALIRALRLHGVAVAADHR
jgi:hypothetical protein